MDKIRRYEKSRSDGVRLFTKTALITLMCILALAAGFLGAAFLSGASVI